MVQTSLVGLGQNLMIARDPASGDLLHRAPCRRFGYPGTQAGVWASLVVMSHSLLEKSPQVSLIERNQEIQTLPANGSDNAFAESIRLRRSRRRFQDARPIVFTAESSSEQ